MGRPITETMNMQFKIYDVATGGVAKWDSGILQIGVIDGMYTAYLGTTTNPVNENVIANSGNYYIECNVDGDTFNERNFIAFTARSVLANKAILADRAITADVAMTLKQKIRSVNSSQTLVITDNVVIASVASNIDLVLPDASLMTGQTLTIKKTDATLCWVNVRAQGGQLIEAFSSTPLMAPGDVVTLLSDGSPTWQVIYRR
jgi:hypothetical protein